jgi:hypothetical protein
MVQEEEGLGLGLALALVGADLRGAPVPYSWCNNGGMRRVRKKKRWRKEEKWREKRRKKKSAPPSIVFCIRHLALAPVECVGEATTFLWMVLLAGPGQQEAHT